MKKINVWKIYGTFTHIDLATANNLNAEALGKVIEEGVKFTKSQRKVNLMLAVGGAILYSLIYSVDKFHEKKYRELADRVKELENEQDISLEETEM